MKKQSAKFKVLSLLLIIVSVFGFSLFTTAEGNEGKIELTKTATKVSTRFDETNLEEGRFADVTLNVKANSYSSEKTVYSKLDIVLVLDSSGSMSFGPDGKDDRTEPNRINAAKEAGKQFINAIMDTTGAVQIGLVDFSSSVNRTQALTTNKQTALDFLGDNYKANGGTNLQSGIAAANEILTKGRTDAKKLVIILTDGIPTYYNYTYTDYDLWSGQEITETIRCGTGSTDEAGGRNKFCPDDTTPSEAAKTALDSLKSSYTNADVYTITLGNESEAATTLEKVNPAETTTTHKYKNVTAMNYTELAKEFRSIAAVAKDVIAKNAKVTDIIPKEFDLTEESLKALTDQGVTVTKEENGETKLEWTIGELQGNKTNSLTYTVKAKDEYHGSIYTNTEATLSAEIDKDNPYPEYKDKTSLTLTFAKPTIEVPAVINDDHYNDHTSYNAYENTTINGESILTNDLLDKVKADVASTATSVEVTDEIIINTNNNVVKIANDTYTISKDGILQGILKMNTDGTFTYTPEKGITGEVSFTYYVKTSINESQEISAVKSNVATVTLNIKKSPKTTISGEKTWDDANNQDGLRPQTITVRLFNGTTEVASQIVSAVNNKWTYEFTNLQKYETGHENDNNYLINYTIKEDTVENYETTINGFDIVNKHTPKLINISVKKIWSDDNNNDGKRPESITLRLFKGEGSAKIEVEAVTLTASSVTTDSATWTYEFTNLPEKENGKKIIYTVTEDEVTDYTGEVTGNTETGFIITNTHTNVTRDLTIEKIWQDSNNNDGKRPESITVRLYKLVGQDKIEVANTAATLTIDNATSENNWSYTYKDLPKYENGEEITYIVEEDALDSSLGYTTTYDYDNYKIFNTYKTEVFNIKGTKTWDDDNNRDGIRPESIEVTLIGKVGAEAVYTETKTVTASTNWEYEFTDLAKYSAGKIIDYKISEKDVKDYSPTITNYDITNTHTPATVTITGTKVWDDSNNNDGLRPESITVILNKTINETTTEVKRITVEADEEGNWNFSFDNLYAKENGEDITYTVDEVTVDGYTTSITDYTITNSHTPETLVYNLNKNWEDYGNNDGLRPEKITINLYADNEFVKAIEMNADTDWAATTGALPKYKEGKEIVYSFVEDEVKGYTSEISPVTDNDENATIVITNYHELETIDLTIEKEWDDEGNEDSRPESIIVNVYANHDEEPFESIEITAEDDWIYTLEGLQKYKEGKEIEYTIKEVELENYVTRYEGYKIINSYKATGEIVPPETGIKTTSSNSNNLYRELIVLLLGATSITYTFKKKEN